MGIDRFLEGRTALVTGGVSGMGRAIALALASAGAHVSIGSLLSVNKQRLAEGEIAHLPDDSVLLEVKKELEAFGVRALAFDLDVCLTESVEQVCRDTLAEFGKIDILVNAAGITAEQTICGHSDALWDKVIDVNLNGTYRTIKACLPGMIENRWGRVINIASTAASVGAVTSGAYCASKAGVVGLTRCVALEGAPHGVTCNAISPTWVNTNFGKQWMTHIAETAEGKSGEQYITETQEANPQGRLVQPEEIGSLALFLCRDQAQGMTMQDLTVSAGSLW